MAPIVRDASHAGSWYTKAGPRLSTELDNWLKSVPTTPEEGSLASAPIPMRNVRAVIAPYYSFKVNGELEATGQFTAMDLGTDEAEHSIEMHLPYVFKIMERKKGPYTIIPILVGSISAQKEQAYGKLLAPYLADPKNLFVISSDFCHWGKRFDYTFKGESVSRDRETPLPIYECIEALDREAMGIIEKMDPPLFTAYLKRTKNTICGRHPIGVLLNAIVEVLAKAKKGGWGEGNVKGQKAELKFVHYAQSSKVVSERDSSVSYASAYFSVE
ncbi:hypothetical protein HK104_003868 [Borealophlyctis nickersoniae]|nr:hypothetical protein HK104_003868 [Borealophlyctis nickersoniae]